MTLCIFELCYYIVLTGSLVPLVLTARSVWTFYSGLELSRKEKAASWVHNLSCTAATVCLADALLAMFGLSALSINQHLDFGESPPLLWQLIRPQDIPPHVWEFGWHLYLPAAGLFAAFVACLFSIHASGSLMETMSQEEAC